MVAQDEKSKTRVLIVEDEYLLADDLAREFSSAGAHIVAFAPSAAKARRIIERGTEIDVAILDVRLQDGDVFEFADELRERNICLVFFTATEPTEMPARFADVAAVAKPAGADQVYHEACRACSAAFSDFRRTGL